MLYKHAIGLSSQTWKMRLLFIITLLPIDNAVQTCRTSNREDTLLKTKFPLPLPYILCLLSTLHPLIALLLPSGLGEAQPKERKFWTMVEVWKKVTVLEPLFFSHWEGKK